MDTIEKYFPDTTPQQREQLAELGGLYADWNNKINVISRKDMEHFYTRHVLHSLAIARICPFDNGAKVLDIGTGGGFPGIPLAIMFPNAEFTLTDSIGKKIMVVNEVAKALGLRNVIPLNARVESISGKFDYAVTRAVAETSTLIGWVWNKIAPGQKGSLANGILCLKGGDLTEELGRTGKKYEEFLIGKMFDDTFFETKKVIWLPR